MINSITLFGVALKGECTQDLFSEVNAKSMPLGYCIAPEACTQETLDYFCGQQADFNSSFYKKWSDVTSKTRLELFMDQLRHYASTYGTGFQGKTYVPNDGNRPYFEYDSYKVITAISRDELLERCMELANSGIALSKEVISFIGNFYITCKTEAEETEIADIKNRELRAWLYESYNIPPVEPFDLLRYISVKATGSAMVIQNKETFEKCPGKFDFSALDEKRLISLSSIFLRYKNFILAFKDKDRQTENNHAINRLRRLAKTHHMPLQVGFWEDVLSKRTSFKDCAAQMDSLTVWKAIKLLMACRERMLNPEMNGYLVRNQKLYVKENRKYSKQDLAYYTAFSWMLEGYLRETLKNVKVRLPKDFRLAMPSSEKSFIGNLPLGSQFKMPDTDGFVGIYWRNEWGAHDFDLHYFDTNALHIGWCSGYTSTDNSIIYSGDMTNADPEATEIMKFGHHCPEGFVVVSRFNGIKDSRFDLIFGSIDQVPQAAMIDPTTIACRAECISESKENTLGYVCDNTFTLMNFRSGNSCVPSSPELVKLMKQKTQTFAYLDEFVTVVPDDYEGDDFVDLSGELAKDAIIKLLS